MSWIWSEASVVDIGSPISAVGHNTPACAVRNDAIAKRLAVEAPSMKPTIIVNPVGVKARVVYPFLSTSERGREIPLGEKR